MRANWPLVRNITSVAASVFAPLIGFHARVLFVREYRQLISGVIFACASLSTACIKSQGEGLILVIAFRQYNEYTDIQYM